MTFYRNKVFPALAEGLWLVFLFLDLSGMASSTPVKFAAICLCAATAWTGARTADGKLVAAALTLTVCADVFLLLLNRGITDQIIGVSIFIVVQLLYAYRLYVLRNKVVSTSRLVFSLIFGLAAFWLIYSFSSADYLNGLPGVSKWDLLWPAVQSAARLFLPLYYFTNLCLNCVEAFTLKADKPVDRFAWGLLLFIGCDVCVGAWNLALFGDFARVGMWFFYLPSQVLIVLSQRLEGDIQ